ncbi:MAG: hypothetical protein COA42_13170 [Alteromonadaceae bacterium]|nr:MAG: hypothetical protein COA42_13170 [Alteromonadaceae bacterium]
MSIVLDVTIAVQTAQARPKPHQEAMDMVINVNDKITLEGLIYSLNEGCMSLIDLVFRHVINEN